MDRSSVSCQVLNLNLVAQFLYSAGSSAYTWNLRGDSVPLAATEDVADSFQAGFFPGCVYLLSTWYARCQ